MADTSGAWKTVIRDVFSPNKDKFHDIARYLWHNPEASYKEVLAHEYLTDFLEKEGFIVQRGFVSATGFRAVYDQPSAGDKRPCIAFICEYDATAKVGHAAGHNLKSESSIAAAVSIKKCLEKNVFPGKVVVLGTPGEDCGCGMKINMVSRGTFSNIDACLMLSPCNYNILFPKFYTLLVVTVTYKGKAAHASAFPWEGRNALDAAVACYNNIALLRQQLKPTWNINGIINSGGDQPNVIPDHSEVKFWLRAPNHKDLVVIQQKCTACFIAAAKASGCEATFQFEDTPYYPMDHNIKFGEVYKAHAESMGVTFTEQSTALETHIGSTDFGNVSQVVPCILPAYDIGPSAHLHSADFHTASGTPQAMDKTFAAAEAIALTAAELMAKPEVLRAIKEEHHEQHGRKTSVIMHRIMSIDD